ncbi:hypothetical protein HELRODRAFT_176424 [Helobdella robusta]|uniref:28S ribosomal protein S18a, mitochondrial n=1 Tax=Helobdella robusta TaxID=6412 RepID=T1FAH8_HELRO|nr:hypothetical protein HELRODRAFT_176424 [Helobdella robusta]ESO00113.1 hypothetical protein HELRODRAFT_176424 [Helobdella robusta]
MSIVARSFLKIEGKYIESERSDYLLQENAITNKEYCALCPKELKAPVKYTDVLIISQFLDRKGNVLPQNITGLCHKAHCRLQRLLFQAQHAGLIDRPANHPDSVLKWNKHNIYYDDHL